MKMRDDAQIYKAGPTTTRVFFVRFVCNFMNVEVVRISRVLLWESFVEISGASSVAWLNLTTQTKY
jgi:hypothetical protein